jgi:hypothetical protein
MIMPAAGCSYFRPSSIRFSVFPAQLEERKTLVVSTIRALLFECRPGAMHRIRQYIPSGPPISLEKFCLAPTAGLRRGLRAWLMDFFPDAGDKVTQVIADHHNDSVVLRDEISPNNFFPIPMRPFVRHHHLI